MKKLKLLQTIQKAVKTKAFIAAVTGIVVVGGVSTYAIVQNQKKAESANASTYEVLDANKETDKSKIEESKVDETKAAEEAKKKEEDEAKKKAEEEAKIKAENEAKKKAEDEAKQKAEEEAKQKADNEAKKKEEATMASKSTSNTASAAKPSASTNTNTAPAPQPAPAPKPTRQSGIDEELTTQINAKNTIPYYTMQKTDPRTETMIAAARTLAFGGAVPDNITHEWKPYANRNTIFKYRAHSVNVEITNDTTYYYTRFKNIPGECDGLLYVIAYWDASINSYKMYYIKIMMA